MSNLTFSQRYGYEEVRDTLQIEEIDQNLKTAIWNDLYLFLLKNYTNLTDKNYTQRMIFWTKFVKGRVDQIPPDLFAGIENWYWHEAEFNEIYDFIEFEASKGHLEAVTDKLNETLAKHNSGYRLINNKIVRITSNEELHEIKTAINSPIEEINEHLKRALLHFSDRESPDYGNSIKESISAVECLCRKLTNKQELGKALGQLEKKGLKLNNQLKTGLNNIYQYTNSEGGIRHALMDEVNVEHEDARFMLVMCSSFVNYLLEKANKLDIKLNDG